MKNLSLFLLSLALALGLASAITLEADIADNALVVDSRVLQESASGSGSVSYPAAGALIAGAADDLGLVVALLEGLLAAFPALGAIIDLLLAIIAAIMAILAELFGRRELRRQEVRGLKSSKVDPELAEGLTTGIEMIEGIIGDLMEAREDPVVGTALDEQICALYGVVDDMEAMLYGGRRLKAKSGKSGFSCPEGGKSGKTIVAAPVGIKSYKAKSVVVPNRRKVGYKSVKAAKAVKSHKAVAKSGGKSVAKSSGGKYKAGKTGYGAKSSKGGK
eukprot:CAMPEP_0113306108 /NCGR_PEP_ID=MMETSP0010_2-20120614/5491_1 /TAXON_ID=216773 ORGANISM="Corethron hystrix, Strain 308" /NCGR_SAMPLE_ID=MMETSP0010_2 /ASSEMBLY_ACC=CAM_ASM_000155 /LENGTH=274 /DNA_ID=CAMNT_0000160709 /DNA_START=312 /DNA_END=1136 /DNA_ORIENTATION=- /assembly_acc=CAM_ASM_000155